MQIIPELRSQAELLAIMKSVMRDVANARWTDVEFYTAINQSLDKWARRVSVPFLYSLPAGWATGQTAYDLPVWMRPPLDVQMMRYTSLYHYPSEDEAAAWIDVPVWDIEPNATGGHTLRLGSAHNTPGRIVWWARNGHVPTTVPTLSAAITDAAATSLTLTGIPAIGNAGFIKIDQEIMAYAGKSQSATITTLQNLTRGYAGSTAATHLISTACYWCVAAHREDLFAQLMDQTRAYLYGLFLTNAAPVEREHHTFQMRYWQQMADEFWKRYAPNRPTKIRLSRQSIGRLY